MSSRPKTFLSEAEYLELERKAEFKSEYFQGEMFAMSGGTRWHGLIATNLVGELRQQLKGKPCQAYGSDLRVRVSPSRLYTYPDVTVACPELKFADDQQDTLLNPTVIVEILSDSTRGYDRGRKFQYYRTLPSLQEYLTVEQSSTHAEQWTRQPGNQWLLSEFSELDQTIELPSIGCVLKMSEIYDKVEFLPE